MFLEISILIPFGLLSEFSKLTLFYLKCQLQQILKFSLSMLCLTFEK